MSRADDLAAIERGMLAVRGLNNVPITSSTVLGSNESGVVLVDASAGAVTITLPPAKKPMDVRVQRVDNSGNRVVIQATGGESITFHTHLRPAGYPFFVLMGAGDFWHLRSDSAGAWVPLDRMDTGALGRPIFETTTAISPGGWGLPNGALLNRADWPWLWDYAQQSGVLVAEAARVGMEGGWTGGDGVTTFRLPELRGEFLRVLDEGRALDSGRIAGSRQKGTLAVADTTGVADGRVAATPGIDAGGTVGDLGMDGISPSDYPYSVYVVGATNALPAAVTIAGATRPRNIAYPARIKLI